MPLLSMRKRNYLLIAQFSTHGFTRGEGSVREDAVGVSVL
jgi:hypothetical protein